MAEKQPASMAELKEVIKTTWCTEIFPVNVKQPGDFNALLHSSSSGKQRFSNKMLMLEHLQLFFYCFYKI